MKFKFTPTVSHRLTMARKHVMALETLLTTAEELLTQGKPAYLVDASLDHIKELKRELWGLEDLSYDVVEAPAPYVVKRGTA